jgi:hypothetical protein
MDELNVEPDSWRELLDALVHGSSTGWIYRGQADSRWALDTTLERTIDARPEGRSDPLRVERGIHRRFIERATTYLTHVPADHDELSWLTLMRHYGAPTRLLDWTKSPLIGLYFAFEEKAPSDAPTRALWCLQAVACRNQFGYTSPTMLRDPFGLDRLGTADTDGTVSYTRPGADSDWLTNENATLKRLRDETVTAPYPVPPPFLETRMAAQQAFFTYDACLNGGIPPKLAIAGALAESSGGFKPTTMPIVSKIILPNEWRLDVLGALRLMGITAATLFPGLDGLGRAARISALLPYELEDDLGA